jgi:putative acetyltransferase
MRQSLDGSKSLLVRVAPAPCASPRWLQLQPPSGEAVIRPYDPQDRDALLTVWAESAAVAHPFWTPAMFEQERRDIVNKYLPVAETYLFERAGAVVGFISLLGNEVGGIFVIPHYHGQGIGRALMDWARGSRNHLELEVFEANEIGRRFYAAYGFRVVGARMDEATGRQVLRLRLPSNGR